MASQYAAIDEPSFFGGGRDFSSVKEITFCHPGYPEVGDCSDFNILLSLSAFDDDCTGIDYGTAHTSCAILVNNRWDGYFSLDRHGKSRVEPPPDGILRANRYYFCLSQDPANDRYPVIPRFRDWRFPHGNLPPQWERLREQLKAEKTDKGRSTNCALSNCGDAVETAHLVPSKQEHWFRINLMKRYSRTALFSTDHINCPANGIPLRCDIHKLFDERHYTFVPKPAIPRKRHHIAPPAASHSNLGNGEEQGEPRTTPPSHAELPLRPSAGDAVDLSDLHVVAHIFNSTPSGDLPRLWHNRLLYSSLPSASVDFLFARFAYTIFAPSVFKYFLDCDQGRTILVWDQQGLKQDVEEASSEKCRSIWDASRTRSQSPNKRQRRNQSQENYREALEDAWDVCSAESQNLADDTSDTSLDEPERGRRRKRESDESVSEVVGEGRLKRGRIEV